jgi:hypothetical protein
MWDDPNQLQRNFFEGGNYVKEVGDWREQAESFAKHIQHVAVESLPNKINPFDRQCFRQAMIGLQQIFEGLSEVLQHSSKSNEGYMHLRRLIAVVFILGKSAVMSPKMKKVWLSEVQSEKGKKSAASRRKEAAEMWQSHALDLAKEIRAGDSSIRQQHLAAKIREKWHLQIKCVCESRLIKSISKWENEGKLTKATQ